MNEPKSTVAGTDWTHLLRDPELVAHLADLLKTYRDAPADRRNEVLLDAMRKIKRGSGSHGATAEGGAEPAPSASSPQMLAPQPAQAPPFTPEEYSPWVQDRRRHPRLKCCVAVEMHVHGSLVPIWGNLSNTSMGGAFVETVTPVPPSANVEIGLWLTTGKMWVKGIVLNGTVTSTSPSFGVRVKFADLEPPERETLRQFVKFIENETRGYAKENGYLAQMKR
jgi:hypothetical protein